MTTDSILKNATEEQPLQWKQTFIYCGAGVAGLLGLGTLPEYWRPGIGSAMQLESCGSPASWGTNMLCSLQVKRGIPRISN